MEILVAVVIIVTALLILRGRDRSPTEPSETATLWAGYDQLQARMSALEVEFRELRAQLMALRAGQPVELAEEVPAPPPEPVYAPEPLRGPLPVPEPALSHWGAPPVPAEASAETRAPAEATTAAETPAWIIPAELQPPTLAATEWIPDEGRALAPAGPSLFKRLLVRLGFSLEEAGHGVSLASIQEWVEGRLLAVVGGIAVLLGAAFFLSLAFTRGWITEPMRVGIALIAGVGLLVLGELAFSRLRGILGHILVAVGLAILEIAFYAGTRLYSLVDVEWGLAGAFVSALAAALIAIRHNSQLVAGYGLVAVLAAPPLLGASPTIVTLLFVAATLGGTTAISLFRTWLWLPPVAFVLAAPQVASYASGAPPVAEGLVAVAGFWLVNLVAAGGEETRHRTDVLRTTTVTLLLADAAFTLWAGFAVLAAEPPEVRAAFTAILGLAHLALGLFFLVRFFDRHPFGLIVAATGLAAIAMSVPIGFSGPPVPISWAAEAAALACVAALRHHPYSAAVSLLLGVMAVIHLVAFEYGLSSLGRPETALPFTGPGGEGWVFAFILLALFVVGWAARVAWIRAGLATVGGLLTAYVLPFELSGAALVAAWAALAAAGTVAFWWVVIPNLPAGYRENRAEVLRLPALVADAVAGIIGWTSGLARGAFIGSAALSGALALLHLAAIEYPAARIFVGLSGAPFSGEPALAFGAVIGAITVTGIFLRSAWARAGLAALGGLVAVFVLPFELSDTPLVATWAALAGVGLILDHRVVAPRLASLQVRSISAASAHEVDPATEQGPAIGPGLARWAEPAFLATALLAGACAIAHLFAFEYPVTNVAGYERETPFMATQAGAFASVLVALALVGALIRIAWVRVGLTALAGLLALWVFPFELSGPALVWMWAALGAGAYVVEARLIQPRTGDAFTGDSLVPGLRRVLRPAVRGLGAVTGIVIIVHLVGFDFPVTRLGGEPLSATPFMGPEGVSLAAILVALVVSGWVMGQRWIRLAMAGIGLALVVYATGFEIPRPHVAAVWAALALASVAVVRRLVPIDLPPPRMRFSVERLGERAPFLAAALAVLLIVAESLVLASPADLVRHVAWLTPPAGTLFVDERTYVLGALALTWLVGGAVWGLPRFLIRGGVVAALVVAWLLPFEIRPAYAMAGWLALAVGGLWVGRSRPVDRLLVAGAAAGLGLVAAAVNLLVVAPPDRLVVDAVTWVEGWRFLTDSTVGLGALALALGLAAWILRPEPWARWIQLACGVATIYVLSVGVVDWFQWDVHAGLRQIDDLASDAQVGLSVLWALAGGITFAGGIISGHPRVRVFGLVLLGLAAVKVFLVDLVGMPIENRVAVLIALGVLLLLSSFIYARIQQPHGRPPRHA